MTHLVHHSPDLGRVGERNRVANLAQAQAGHHFRLLPVEPDGALDERDLQLLVSHDRPYAVAPVNSATSLPRSLATATGSFKLASPVKGARTTFGGSAHPI